MNFSWGWCEYDGFLLFLVFVAWLGLACWVFKNHIAQVASIMHDVSNVREMTGFPHTVSFFLKAKGRWILLLVSFSLEVMCLLRTGRHLGWGIYKTNPS